MAQHFVRSRNVEIKQPNKFYGSGCDKSCQCFTKTKPLKNEDLRVQTPIKTIGEISTEYDINHSGVSRILATKGTSITTHLLPGLSDWESLVLVVETHSHQTGCSYRPYKCT